MRVSRIAIVLLVIASLLVLVGCRMAPLGAPSMSNSAAPAIPQAEAGKLTLAGVWARPAPLAGGNGAIYMTVLNGLDQDVQLVSAASTAANVVETHETVEDNGVMKMNMLPDGFPIPAGSALELKPGGKHIMLIGLVQPLNPGDEITVTLNFDTGDVMTVTAPVKDMGGMDAGGMNMGGMATPTP